MPPGKKPWELGWTTPTNSISELAEIIKKNVIILDEDRNDIIKGDEEEMPKKKTKTPWSIMAGALDTFIVKTSNRKRCELIALSYGDLVQDIFLCSEHDDPYEAFLEIYDREPDWPLVFNVSILKREGFTVVDDDGKELSLTEIKRIEKEFNEENEENKENKINNKYDGDKVSANDYTDTMEEPMNDYDLKSRLIGNAKDLGQSAFKGSKLALVSKANDAAYVQFKNILISKGGFDEKSFDNPIVEALIRAGIPAFMSMAAVAFEDRMPHLKHVQPILHMSITETTREYSDEVMEAAIPLFQAMYSAYTQPQQEKKQLRIHTDYEDLRLEKLKSIAKARQLGLRARIGRDKLIAALRASDAQAEAEAIEAEAEENEVQKATM